MFDIVDRFKGINNFGKKNSFSGENFVQNFQKSFEEEYLIEPQDGTLRPLKLQIIGNESISMSSDITDNYVENNVALQDHISIKPMIYTVEGEVGELIWYSKNGSNDVLGNVANKLYPIASFSQTLSKGAARVQNTALKVLGVIDSIDNYVTRMWNFFENNESDTEQKKVYKYLLMLWQARTPINIKTPWSNLSNFVIQNIEISQPDRTVEKSKIRISFKEFKTVKRKKTSFDINKYLGRGSAQNAELTNKGTTTGITATEQMCKARQWCPTDIFTKN